MTIDDFPSDHSVYALVASDARDEYQYIGVTAKLARRLREHLGRAERGGTKRVSIWIREVLARGAQVQIVSIQDDLISPAAYDLEARLIRALRRLSPLKN